MKVTHYLIEIMCLHYIDKNELETLFLRSSVCSNSNFFKAWYACMLSYSQELNYARRLCL